MISIASTLDLVLLTHPDIAHMGALPLLAVVVKCPILATDAAVRMGELALFGSHEDADRVRNLGFNLEDIVSAFQAVTPLKFTQPWKLNIKGLNLTLRAHAAGRLLGGCFWTIDYELQSIAYCVDYHLVGERHLDGLALHTLKNINVLITDNTKSDKLIAIESAVAPGSIARSGTEERLLQSIIPVLRAGGTVLIPADPTGRLFELVLLLEATWAETPSLKRYPVVWVSTVGDMMLDQAKTRLNWMGAGLVSQFDKDPSKNPFLLHHIELFSEAEHMFDAHHISRPKVIIANMGSLEFGDSRDIFMRICGDSKNRVVFLDRGRGLCEKLIEEFIGKGKKTATIELNFHHRIPIPEDKLRKFYEKCLMSYVDLPELEPVDRKEPIILETQRQGPFINAPGYKSRMFAFTDRRLDHDEYGTWLKPEETELWKSCDAEGLGLEVIEKPEQKNEKAPEYFDWREDLRLKFREPKRIELQRRQVRVNLSVAYVPFQGVADFQQMRRLVTTLAPQQLVLIGKSQLLKSRLADLQTQIHFLTYPKDHTVTLDLHSRKRELTLATEVWERVSFRKVDESRLAWLSLVEGDECGVAEDEGLALRKAALFVGDLTGVGLRSKRVGHPTFRHNQRHMELSGDVTTSFYDMRRKLYKHMQLV